MWTGDFGFAMLHDRRLCTELIPTFTHGREFRALITVGLLKAHPVRRRRVLEAFHVFTKKTSPENGPEVAHGLRQPLLFLANDQPRYKQRERL